MTSGRSSSLGPLPPRGPISLLSVASRLDDVRRGLHTSQELFGAILTRAVELKTLPAADVEQRRQVLKREPAPSLLLAGSGTNELTAQADALDGLREQCDTLCTASKDLRLALSIATHRAVSRQWHPGPRDARTVYNAGPNRNEPTSSPRFCAVLAAALTEQLEETSTNLTQIQAQLTAYIPGTTPKGDDFTLDAVDGASDSEPILFRPLRR